MIDLEKLVTVFLIKCGDNPNYEDALQALKNQNSKFQINIIEDISPLSAAFQEMNNRCTTPYYIECDEDMILDEDTVEKMFRMISSTGTHCAMMAFKLHDVHIDFDIFGVKIYKTDIVKQYPYNLNHPSCEVEMMDRMKKDGYKYFLQEIVVGKHSPKWSNNLIFERYYNLMKKFLIYRYQWLEPLPNKLIKKCLDEPSEVNLYALLGAYTAITNEKVFESEKNFVKRIRELDMFTAFISNPESATIFVTDRCNFKCTFCMNQHQEREPSKDFTAEMVDNLFFKFPTVKGVCLAGFGEPFMHEGLFSSLIPQIRKHKAFVGLITNGSMILNRFGELNANPPDYLSVSLNSHDEEEHYRITGSKSFETVVRGIKDAVQFSKFKTYVSAVVSTENIKTVPELIRFVHGLGVTTLHLHNILPHCKFEGLGDFKRQVLTVEHKAMVESWKTISESCIVKSWPVLLDYSKSNPIECQFPFKTVAVNGNGSLSICNSVMPCDQSFGRVFDYVAWQSPVLEKFRKDHMENKIWQCQNCFRNWR